MGLDPKQPGRTAIWARSWPQSAPDGGFWNGGFWPRTVAPDEPSTSLSIILRVLSVLNGSKIQYLGRYGSVQLRAGQQLLVADTQQPTLHSQCFSQR